jgi:hypothetical protein
MKNGMSTEENWLVVIGRAIEFKPCPKSVFIGEAAFRKFTGGEFTLVIA